MTPENEHDSDRGPAAERPDPHTAYDSNRSAGDTASTWAGAGDGAADSGAGGGAGEKASRSASDAAPEAGHGAGPGAGSGAGPGASAGPGSDPGPNAAANTAANAASNAGPDAGGSDAYTASGGAAGTDCDGNAATDSGAARSSEGADPSKSGEPLAGEPLAGEPLDGVDLDALIGEHVAREGEGSTTGQEDEAGSANTDGAPEPTLADRLAASETLAAEHWDRLMRLQAEMENQRKRAQRDVTNARKFALEGIAGDLLPVRDSLELGLQAASADGASLESLREGSELTLKMLAQVLEKHAIAEINPEGEKFDPEFHQAMSAQSVEGVAPNTVVTVMQKGYTLNERLIRPALVMVSK